MSESSAAETIQQTIIDEANAEAKKTIREAEMEAKKLREQAITNARASLVSWAERQRQMAKSLGDRVVGKARNDAHMRVLDTKAQLIDNAFTEARKRFQKERTTAQYKGFLKNLIISAGIQIGGGDIVVKARKEDETIVGELKGLATAISKGAGQSAKVTVAKKPMDMLGGVFVENKDGNITVDYRLDTLLEQVAQQRRNDIARTLFPHEKATEPASE